jgi:hypothetical protein
LKFGGLNSATVNEPSSASPFSPDAWICHAPTAADLGRSNDTENAPNASGVAFPRLCFAPLGEVATSAYDVERPRPIVPSVSKYEMPTNFAVSPG